VLRIIPYRNLVIMQKDKLHPVYGGKVMQEVSEEEFFAGKGGINFTE
jgi:hypothetical protein